MKKKYAFYVSLIVTFVVAGNFLFFIDVFPEREIVEIRRVIDGDTLELADERIIRLLNINTPEKGEFFGEDAEIFLKNYEKRIVELEVAGVGRYGRILGRLYFEEEYINLNLVEEGFAHVYLADENELKNFKDIEREAREKGKGIWEKSEQYSCLKTEINKNEEYVFIENECESNLEGWSLKDESTTKYIFDKVNEKTFTLYSGKGKNTENELYWGRGKAWNDDKDSIFIRDEKGKLVFYDSYGY